jgi:peroxiredoxin
MKTTYLLAATLTAALAFSGSALAQEKKDEKKPEHKQEQKHEKDHKDHDHKKDEKKAETKSEGAKIGAAAPDFKLTDTAGKAVSLADYKGKVVVLEWFNPGCPVVQMHYKAGTSANLVKEFGAKGVVFLCINSGAPGNQGHGTEANSNAKKDWKMEQSILLDESGTVGKAYGAKTTPHCFVIDKDGKLAYAGAIDNGNGGKVGDKNYVREALTAVLAGKPVATTETKAYGCSVKYGADKKGN